MKPRTLTTSFRWSLDVGLVSQQCKVELHMAHTLNALAIMLFESTQPCRNLLGLNFTPRLGSHFPASYVSARSPSCIRPNLRKIVIMTECSSADAVTSLLQPRPAAELSLVLNTGRWWPTRFVAIAAISKDWIFMCINVLNPMLRKLSKQ
jgi:hypothetical protein